MRIDENYSMVVTKDSVHLHYEKEGELNEKGKPVLTKNDWYYPNVKMALNKYLNDKVGDANDIKEIYNKIVEAEERINNLKL